MLDELERFCEEALVGCPASEWPAGLMEKLPDVLEEAVMEHHDLDRRFDREAHEDPYEAVRVACQEGSLGRWLVLELAATPLLPRTQRGEMMQNLLRWLRRNNHHRHFTEYPPYYTGVDFLIRSGESLKPWFPCLLQHSHGDDVTLAPEMVRRAIEDPEIPPLWTAFLVLRLPVVFEEEKGQKRFPALRECADVFFASSLDTSTKDLIRRAVDSGRPGHREGIAFPVPPELAQEIPSFVQIENTIRQWNGHVSRDYWSSTRVAGPDLYPNREDWLPYAQALQRQKALAMGSRGLGRAIRAASDPRELNAMVEPLLKSAVPMSPDVELALRAQTLAAEAATRAVATETLLAYGSDPIGDAERSQRDVAEQVRRAPLKIAISQVKMSTLPSERRRVLLGYVRAHQDEFDFSPKQRTSFSRWIRVVGIDEGISARKVTESKPLTLEPLEDDKGAS